MVNLIFIFFEKLWNLFTWLLLKAIEGIGWGIARFFGKVTIGILAIIFAGYIGTNLI